jgi:beta-glucanase (GH16 family)
VGLGGWGIPVFDDEFNGTRLDSTWAASCPEYGGNLNGNYTSPVDVAVSDGDLVLTQGSLSVGACVTTRPGAVGNRGFTFQYGYAEARVYFPGDGTSIYNWPAWWTSSSPWPEHGETDIAEGLHGRLTTNYHAGYVCPSCVGGSSITLRSGPIPGAWSSGFHIYGLDREPGVNTIYWDGQQVGRYAVSDPGALNWLLVNVGDGVLGGQTVIGLASRVKVDYVRVWTRPA